MAFAANFAGLTAIIWALTAALYALSGLAIRAYARRHPERKIQSRSDGEARAGAEIRESLRSIAITSACKRSS